ncbi:MAG TPA: isoprenylcysteine carboxylmethyltransferase family protein [Streptosporangiaceae bacterium]|jgi:protein-S-isoprenylcysteine O-methyltransferase Ste14
MRSRFTLSDAALAGYAGLGYLAFLAATLWAAGFLAGLSIVPVTAASPARLPAWAALLADAGLLLLFAAQHTVMARPGFKRRLARLLPPAAERSSYVLAAGLALLLVFWQWQPLPGSVWRVRAGSWADLLWAVYAAGWLIAVSATFMIDHLDFLGIRQARWGTGRGPYRPPSFSERWLYAWVRHPMMTGLLIAFWATPVMTVSHLFFAAAATGYIAVGLRFEERDLRRQLGPAYGDYASRVPALVPRPGPRQIPAGAANPPA